MTAVYAGDSNFNPNTSAAATITVAALTPGFALTGTPGTVTITGGAQGVVTLNLAANASFSGAVTLSCSGLPADGTCSINPGSVALTAGGEFNGNTGDWNDRNACGTEANDEPMGGYGGRL